MTREEAVSRLKKGEPFSETYDPAWDEALKMAILALSSLDFDVQEAYCRGKIDGIKECTAKLKKMNEELAKVVNK